MQGLDLGFSIVILIMSVVIHEVSHGYIAYMLGDITAKASGRLTLNPAKHLDPVGSFIVPVIAFMTAGFIFGWAKPVPYNPYNLTNKKWGEAMVAFAGPASNLLIALIFGMLIRFSGEIGIAGTAFVDIFATVALINLILAVFLTHILRIDQYYLAGASNPYVFPLELPKTEPPFAVKPGHIAYADQFFAGNIPWIKVPVCHKQGRIKI